MLGSASAFLRGEPDTGLGENVRRLRFLSGKGHPVTDCVCAILICRNVSEDAARERFCGASDRFYVLTK